MSARTFTGDEAAALIADYTTTPRITFGDECLGGVPLCVDGRELLYTEDPDDTDGDWIYVDRWEAAMHNAAPGLAATVVQLSTDLHRVEMERDGARKALDESQAARIAQSLELAEARAQIVRLHVEAGVVDGLRMALDNARGSAAAWEMVARDKADRADRLQERVAELESAR